MMELDTAASTVPHGFKPGERVKVELDRKSNRNFDGSLAKLHEIAWGGDPWVIFRHYVPRRDDVNRAETRLPENPIHMTWGNGIPGAFRRFFVSSLLVREEYSNVLQDIIWLMNHQDLSPGDGRQYIRPWHHDEAKGEDVLYNPFLQDLSHRTLKGVVILGNPGIGKTACLIYLLVLRLLAKRTTVFMVSPHELYLFNDEGVHCVYSPVVESANLEEHIQEGTWFLVDSNSTLVSVPSEIINTALDLPKCLVIQAASPRLPRISWWSKMPGYSLSLWMAPWTVGELVVCRDFQRADEPCTEAELVDFAKKYGTMARMAYAFARNAVAYERRISDKINRLTRDLIGKLLAHASDINMEEDFSHLLLKMQPRSQNRLNFSIVPVTDYVFGQILDKLTAEDQQAGSALYRLFVKDAHLRAAAGYLLETRMLERFARGGEWKVTNMVRQRPGPKNTWWHSNVHSRVRYLRLGFRNVVAEITDSAAGNEAEGLHVYDYPSAGNEQLITGFYEPLDKNQASFDAFVYDARQRRATLFQVSVSNEHEISVTGLLWFSDRNIKTDLVVVTAPLVGDEKEKIFVDKDHEEKLEHVYLLVIDDIDV